MSDFLYYGPMIFGPNNLLGFGITFQPTSGSYAVSGQVFVAYTSGYSGHAKTFMVRSDQRRLKIDRLFGNVLDSPITIILECLDDAEFFASVPDLNMAMTGENCGDAILALKEYIEMSIESFRNDRDNLGPEPKRQLEALEAYIGGRRGD